MKEYELDPETKIRKISDWGSECGRGFVSDERFARSGDRVIKRTSRNTSRKWRQLNSPVEKSNATQS